MRTNVAIFVARENLVDLFQANKLALRDAAD
jgi:hypothetical protein